MKRLWIRVKKFLYRYSQDTVCGACGGIIPFGKSAWFDKLDNEWHCRTCAPEPW